MIKNTLNIKCSNCGKILATIDTYKDIENTMELKKDISNMHISQVHCQDCYERGEII